MENSAPISRIIAFHTDKMRIVNGFNRSDLLQINDAEFERYHGFIQWAFPTPERSTHNFSAPLLDLESAVWLAQDPATIRFLEEMTVRFLKFLKGTDAWKARYNHNQLRVTRILQCLRVLHSTELACWFQDQVRKLAGDSYDLMTKARGFWDHQTSPSHDRIAGAVVGLAIGDALGAPVEFSSRGTFVPVTGYRDGGRFPLPPGAWTDDTAMALCLADSLILREGFDPRDLLTRFCDWAEYGTNSSTGVAVGIGQNTLRTLGDFYRTGKLKAEPLGAKSDGNGSLMRLSPMVCFVSDDENRAIRLAGEQSKTTHASPIAEECCRVAASLIWNLLNGEDYATAKSHALEHDRIGLVKGAVSGDLRHVGDDQIPSGGYVLDTLRAAMWSVENSSSFEEAVLMAVNLGDDADTTGAVAGQLAGALYGYASVSPDLKSGLVEERRIYVTSQMLQSSNSSVPIVASIP